MASSYFKYSGTQCGKKTSGGTKTKGYIACVCELPNGMPATRAAVNAPATPAPGDAKIYDEPFDFPAAEAGFWREFDIIIDEGEIKDLIEGSKANVGIGNMATFKIPGFDEIASDWAQQVVDNNGCGLLMIPLRNGKYVVVGSTDNPLFLESSEGGTGRALGDAPGYVFNMRSDSGLTAFYYDADTHGIQITPTV